MAELKISQMDAAQPLTGAELVPLVQGGINVTATAADLRGTADTLPGLAALLAGKQSTLVSGVDIKTLNGESLLGAGDLTIAVVGGVGQVMTPANVFPLNSGVLTNSTPRLTGSSYYNAYDVAQSAIQVQVSTSTSFASPIYSSGDQPAGVAFDLPSGVLSAGTDYYWRLRYKDAMGAYSGWSAATGFTTSVVLNEYIPTPAATPAIGDAFEGGFYAGMVWNEIAQSSSITAIGTGTKTFTVSNMAGAPIVYAGQMLEVRSRANPTNKMIGTVVSASGTALAINVNSIGGNGTFSDWSVMSRFRVIVAPKASGEIAGIKMKSSDTASPADCCTLTEGLRATQAMRDADASAVYPAAHWARGLAIGGRTDWYIPARDELELLWRNLKPTTDTNWVTADRPVSANNYQNRGSYGDVSPAHGLNKNTSPAGAAYTAVAPGQTAAAAFRAGGAEQFIAGVDYYWSSSEYSAGLFWGHRFRGVPPAYQGVNYSTFVYPIRAVRRSII